LLMLATFQNFKLLLVINFEPNFVPKNSSTLLI
jgi:hypothetical protein